MKRNPIRKVQAILLLATLAVVGTALIPAQADNSGPCGAGNACRLIGTDLCFKVYYQDEWVSCNTWAGGMPSPWICI